MFRFSPRGLTSLVPSCLSRHIYFGLLLAFLAVFTGNSFAQQLTGSLSGTVYDQSGAVVPNAKVTLTNEASHDVRQSVANSSGFFTFAAVQPGSYSVKIEATGFDPWQENGVTFTQGASLTLPNINLKVGSTSQNVEVVTSAEAVVPTDTGEVSTTLDSKMVSQLPIVGRDAGELIKIMPGMAVANGLTPTASFNVQTVGTNNGPVGSYSGNGTQPNGSMAYMLDGANLLDPGNEGTQIANINQDMVSEVKVLMSGYDAAYAKGPIVFQAISKSGGAQFHGEAYLYARNNIFNSIDSYQKSQGTKKADAYEYYPGGNIGGPVLLPFTKFNRNRDKLFFWFGYEYMRQQPAGTLWESFVPTADMRAGNFTPAALAQLPQGFTSITAAPCLPTLNTSTGIVAPRQSCGGLSFPTGQIPTSLFDPNSLALLKTFPMPNADPATHGGNNFTYLDQSPQNRWEQTEKIDYSISDSTKLTVSYARQDETDIHPVQVWWAPSESLPYPSPLIAPTTANVVMANLTHVFSPTTTNETVFTYARYINPLTPENKTAINPSTYGFNVPALFGINRTQIPNILSWGGNGAGFAGYDTQAVFGGGFNGGAFGGLKSDPAIYDNLSKVVGTHTMKFGAYWDSNGNVQSSGNQINGTYEFETYGNTSTGNLWADFLLGRASSYSQANIIPVDDLKYHQYSLYGQDSWKATKRLTVNYGIRADHYGQWYPNTQYGAAVFDVGKFYQNPNAVNAGLEWHSIDSSVPLSGYKSPLFYYEPRVGAAFDIFGNGKTVLRGGFAVFRYQIAYNVVSGPAELPEGAINFNSNTGLTSLAQAATFSVPTGTQNLACGTGCSISPLQKGDGRVPYTENYNVSVDQVLPGKITTEFSYVGNRSRDLLIAGGNGDFYDLNMVPLGAFFQPDPVTGAAANPFNVAKPNDYRPFQSYGDINIAGHGSYANFNSFQASASRQFGKVGFLANYTFGKVLGTKENYSGNGPSDGAMVDPFNIKDNYGLLAYNHTHIFNAGYNVNLPSPIHGNAFLKGAVNGWQLTGTTTYQSGAPLQPNTNGTLNASYGNYVVNGTNLGGVSTSSWLGSNATGLALVPVLTCNPTANLKSGYYFNPACFSVPAQGTNGTLQWPNIHGPGAFNSDLGLYKNFKVTERQAIQFRVEGFNFLNHANSAFGLQGTNDIRLNFGGGGSLNPLTTTNTNPLTTGKPLFTTGMRIVEFAVKYNF